MKRNTGAWASSDQPDRDFVFIGAFSFITDKECISTARNLPVCLICKAFFLAFSSQSFQLPGPVNGHLNGLMAEIFLEKRASHLD